MGFSRWLRAATYNFNAVGRPLADQLYLQTVFTNGLAVYFYSSITTSPMLSTDTLRTLALSFPEATEEPHFEKTSFRVKKKIFATYDAATGLACLKLSEAEQDVFAVAAKGIIYPVANQVGQAGLDTRRPEHGA
jgi:hypothetical protein